MVTLVKVTRDESCDNVMSNRIINKHFRFYCKDIEIKINEIIV